MQVRTVSERKAEALAARLAALAELRASLGAYAAAAEGRFLLYGSAARGDMRFDSDVDLLLEFEGAEAERAAWTFAELESARLGLPCDIRPVGWCGAAFLAHVLPQAVALP